MLGHHWESAEGKIVEVTAGPAGRYGVHSEYHYVVEVRTPAGEVLRGNVSQQSSDSLAVGTLVRVQVNAKTQEIRLDSKAGAGTVIGVSVADQVRAASADFDSPLSTAGQATAAGTGPTRIIVQSGSGIRIESGSGPVDLSGLLGRLGAAGGSPIVIGPGGQQVNVDGSEMRALTAAVLSGDPVARQSAIDRLHQIRAEMTGQAGAGPADGSPTTAGARTAEDRIAVLQHLLDQGLLTESEFQAQRQRIISEI